MLTLPRPLLDGYLLVVTDPLRRVFDERQDGSFEPDGAMLEVHA